jgi:5-methylcytosine-specific restriction endonuclease McrA
MDGMKLSADKRKYAREQMRRWRAAHPEQAREASRTWRAAHLAQCRERDRLAQRRIRLEHPERRPIVDKKYYATHKKEHAKRGAEWEKRNPAKAREMRRRACRKYHAAHPERARINNSRRRATRLSVGGRHTLAEWIVLCWASAWRCAYCRCVLDEKSTIQEHRIPLSRGGTDNIENIAVSCAPCNYRKWAKTDVEFMAQSAAA